MASKRRAIRACRDAMGEAVDYPGWLEAAEAHDHLTGLDAWRAEDDSRHYDAALLREDLGRMQALPADAPLDEVVALLHEGLHRHLNDVLAPAVYRTALAGPKRLVTAWLDAAEAAIERAIAAESPAWPTTAKLTLLRGAYRNLGRSALLLSGGATLGFYHLGVVRALWRAELLPDVIVGASMGAMIAAGVCSRTDAEVDALFADEVPDIERVGLQWRSPGEAWAERSLMRPERLLATIRRNCGRYTFAEAYQRSRRVLNISLMSTRTRQKPRILNYLTAPDVWVPRAALASSAVPGLFPPVSLTRRGADGEDQDYVAGETWIDGSFGHDLPTMRVSRLHNVNHFIVSQTQPHALPMLAGVERTGLLRVASEAALSALQTQGLQALALSRRVASRTPLRATFDLAHGLVSQELRGDIDIHPRFDPRVYGKLLTNPSRQDLALFVREGERGTWPKLALIRDATRISRCLARCERVLEAQL